MRIFDMYDILPLKIVRVGCRTLGILIIYPWISFSDVNVTVNWDQVKRAVDPLAYGINASHAHNSNFTERPNFIEGLDYATKKSDGSNSLIRLHSNGLVKFWSPNGVWDVNKIKSALGPLIDANLNIQIDIDAAIGGNGKWITPKDAADLVRIVNIDAGFNVKYWEVFNEKWDTTPAMLKAIYKAMKEVDPTITIGGPGWFYLQVDWLTDFVRDALPDIDFVSFHHYAVAGDTNRSDADVYDGIQKLGEQVKQFRANIDQVSPNRHIPIQWNEYNIHWRWRSPDPRVKTNKGAVVYALFMAAAVDNGADISNVWNECEDAFGFMTCDGDLLLTAHVFSLFNQHMYGSQVAASSADIKSVVAYATKTDSTNSLVLINRSPSDQTVPVNFSGVTPSQKWQRHQVWEDGYSELQTVEGSEIANGITIPDNSVTVLTYQNGPPNDSGVTIRRIDGEGNTNNEIQVVMERGKWNTSMLIPGINGKEEISIDVYDILGIQVAVTSKKYGRKHYLLRMNDPGLYFINVKSGNKSIILKTMVY